MTATLDTAALAQDTLDPRLLGIQAEAKLREWSIHYRYEPEYPLAEIRAAEWAQVREDIHRQDKDSLAEFRTQMAQGTAYPPIILMDPDVMIDGNTRAAAARQLHRRTFPAFVAQFNSVDLAKTFAAAMNQLNGRRLTSGEAYSAALTMMGRGMADEAVAREVGRSVEMVRQMRRQKEFAERSAALPEITSASDVVSQKNQIKLAQITHNAPFVEAVKLVAETKPPAATVTDIVKAATSARTDTDAIAAIAQIKTTLSPAGPPPHRITVPQEVRLASANLSGLLKFADEPLKILDLADGERRAAAIDKWRRVRDLADEVLKLYGA